MTDRGLLRAGLVGAIVAAVCCFTPVLVVLAGLVGLSAVVGWLDYALFPALFACMGLVAHGLFLRSGRRGPSPAIAIVLAVAGFSAVLFWLEFRGALWITVAVAAVLAAYAICLRLAGRRSPPGAVWSSRDG